MGIELRLNGAGSSEGFVVAGGRAVELTVQSDDDSCAPLELRAAGAAVDNLTLTPCRVEASADPVCVQVSAAGPSEASNDQIIEVVSQGQVEARFELTSVRSPSIQFQGRYQCRLATDPDGYLSPWGQNSSFGMYSVQGPDPDSPIEPPLDRVIRFQGAVALRKHASPVGVFVHSVQGRLKDGPTVTFQAGDAVIGQPVALGPECKFEARDGTFAQPGFEPIGAFEFSIGSMYSGASEPALPRPNPADPPPNNSPYADGFFRMDQMSPRKPADFGYPDPDWNTRSQRIPAEKLAQLEADTPADQAGQTVRDRRIQEHRSNMGGIAFPIRMLERYSGQVDQNVVINPQGSPSLAALQSQASHRWHGEFFDFDSDVQCGTVWGTLG